MNMLKSRALWVMLVASLLLVGCKTEQPGVTNRAGTIKATLAANPASVTEAAKEVLDDMDLVLISSNATTIDGRVVARTAQDVKVRVDSKSIGENVSEVFIRVGGMGLGDSELSLTILEEIKVELGMSSDKADEAKADEAEKN